MQREAIRSEPHESIPEAFVDEAVRLLVELIRIDTSNPPGNERPAAELAAEALRAEGLEPVLLEARPGRSS